MAASEHTPHYNLSQFGPDDRPSWIDDYNTDMRTIDTALTQGGSQPEPLFCTAQVGQWYNFTATNETPYIAAFSKHEGTIDVDYTTHTIPITKSGYYALSGQTVVTNVTLDSGNNKSLQLGIGKYSENGSFKILIVSDFTKSYEPIFNESNVPSEAHDWGIVQSCSITPAIVHLNAGDKLIMALIAAYDGNDTIHGNILTMYLTAESKMLDNNAS